MPQLETDCTRAWTGSPPHCRRGNKCREKERKTYLTRVFLDIQIFFFPHHWLFVRHWCSAPRAPKLHPSSSSQDGLPSPCFASTPYRFCKIFCEITSAVPWLSPSLPHAPFPLVQLILSRQLNYPIKWIKKNLWLSLILFCLWVDDDEQKKKPVSPTSFILENSDLI